MQNQEQNGQKKDGLSENASTFAKDGTELSIPHQLDVLCLSFREAGVVKYATFLRLAQWSHDTVKSVNFYKHRKHFRCI